MIGQWLTLICRDYIYAGKVDKVMDNFVILYPAYMIFDLGQWKEPTFKTYERIPGSWSVLLSAVESFGAGKAASLADDIPQSAETVMPQGLL